VDRHSAWPANSGGERGGHRRSATAVAATYERASSSLGPVAGLKYRQLTLPLKTKKEETSIPEFGINWMFYLKEKSTVVYSRIFLELFWLFQIVPLASVGISVEEKKNESFSRSGTLFFKRDLYQTTCALLRDLRFTK
jgi:hypothetical protein